MKNIVYILFTALFIMSCEKNSIGDFDDSYQDKENTNEKVINKKGSCFAYKKKAWSHKISKSTPFWYYNWGNTPRVEIPDNVEFVPMFWGKGSVSDSEIQRLIQLKEEGTIKYILGFNEPDGKTQANMSVDEAIALWPKLESIGLPLGSPATVHGDNAWMQEFMQKATDLELQVDFIAVHYYGGSNPLSFINKLKKIHQLYNKPIWITEFAVADWSATSNDTNKYSEEEVLYFMKEVLPALDQIDWIHRYSWYDGAKAPLITSALFDTDDNLTALGQFYATYQPNELIGPGTDTEYIPPVDEDEILINGGFETGEKAPWGGFKSGAVGEGTTMPKTGKYCGRIENGDGSFVYIVDVEAGTDYDFKFFSKWAQNIDTSFTPIIKDNTAGSSKAKLFTLDAVSQTDQWTASSLEFTVPDGVSQLKIVFFKANGFPPFFIDDVSLKIKE